MKMKNMTNKRIVNADDIGLDDDDQRDTVAKIKLCDECKDRFKCGFYIRFIIGGFFRRIKYAIECRRDRKTR